MNQSLMLAARFFQTTEEGRVLLSLFQEGDSAKVGHEAKRQAEVKALHDAMVACLIRWLIYN